ncbi:hypothetical protein DFP72DRAFT_900727 [Ephemerocybe angulata]|uniref:Uncharacterized protein n=1 Tax=Ephemerocybe angulata TaxID=980116 RepID=A0A8H6M436_9AGAR|nr:hypothetical protein DFP72DRAFT_900727 [Tulosesus angulatus]
MALPSSITTKNLSGRYTMNKALSDATAIDQMLGYQGIGWIKRKAIAIGTITLTVTHTTSPSGDENITIDNHLTGGIPGSREERPLDGEERGRSDMHFGKTLFYTKRVSVKDAEPLSGFLKGGKWTDDTVEAGLIETKIRADVGNGKAGWVEHHIWGVEEFNGERRFTRRISFEGAKKEKLEIVMYFDYLGA